MSLRAGLLTTIQMTRDVDPELLLERCFLIIFVGGLVLIVETTICTIYHACVL